MNIIWLGHSGFRIETKSAVLLIDPWLDGNPMFPVERKAEATAGATHILLTHAHGDHASGALKLAAETGARIAAIHELAEWLGRQGAADVVGFGKGGTIDCADAHVTMVNASHSASIDFQGGDAIPGGSAAGFMIKAEDQVIYVSGDTDIMADMEWMGDYHKPTIGILSCGGHYTMDMDRAAYAARRYFKFHTIIPCHYRTFPLLAQDASALKAGVPPGIRVIEPEVLEPISF